FDNALRYTPAGGRTDVRAVPAPPADQAAPPVLASDAAPPHQAGESARLASGARDTRAAVPSDALPRSPERHYRVGPARPRADSGTGVGRSIVKHLVERMGGDVTAESALGKGTTIRFTLPAAPVPAPAGGADGDAAATTPAAAAGNPTPTGGG